MKLQYLRIMFVGFVLLAWVGCSRESRKAAHLERAQTHFKSGEYDRAEIEYLNVLRLDPTNRAAIRDLGAIYYQQGRLPRALLFLSKGKDLDTNDLETRLNLGLTELALGGSQKAHEEAQFILDHNPTNGPAMLLLVDSSVKTNELADARDCLDKLKTVAGEIPEWHLARGSLALRSHHLEAAAAAFHQALALGPRSSAAHAAMGALYAFREDRTNAAREFRAAAELAPPRSAHRIRYANFEAAIGDTNAALQVLQRISKEAPDYLPALLRQAEFALAARQFQTCEGLLNSVLQRDVTSLGGMQLMAQLRVAKGDLPGALTELDHAIQEYPRIAQLRYRKALVQLANNDLPATASSLNQALSLQPDFPEAVLLSAQISIRRGNVDSAITSLTALLRDRPGLTPAQLLLATAYRARGNLDDALKIYGGMARQFTNNPEPLYLAGLVLRQQGRNDDARRSFERAVALSRGFVPPLDQLVGMDLEAGHFDAARSRVQRAMDLYPKAPQPVLLLARVYLAETNQPQAEKTLLRVLELAPDSQEARRLLARVYGASGRYQQALQRLQDVVSHNPGDVASWLLIAHLQGSVSNYVAAQDAYEKVLTIDPKHRAALNDLARLCAEHLGDLDRAYDLANRAHAAYPDDAHTTDTLGWVCYQRGEYARALTLLQQSADQLPEEPEVLFHLGMAHYMLGEEAAAGVALQSALEREHEGAWRETAQECLQILAFDPATADSQSLARLEKWKSQRSDEPPLLMRLAAVLEREGAWDQAAAAYQAALKVNPSLVNAVVRLAQLDSTRLNKPGEALDLARKARSLSPEDPLIAHTLGVLAYNAADYPWAFSLLGDSARKLPNDLGVQYDWAWAAYSLGQTGLALRAMSQVAAAGPAALHYQDAKTFTEIDALLSDPDQAEKSAARVQELLRQQPDYVPALMARGGILEKKGDFAAACDTYNRVLELRPLFAPVQTRLAMLYFDKLHDADKAYKHAIKAREAFPDDVAVARILGILEYDRGQYASAAHLLTRAASVPDEAGDVIYYFGMTQFKLKQAAASKATLTRALKMSPESPLAAEARKILSELK